MICFSALRCAPSDPRLEVHLAGSRRRRWATPAPFSPSPIRGHCAVCGPCAGCGSGPKPALCASGGQLEGGGEGRGGIEAAAAVFGCVGVARVGVGGRQCVT